MKETPTAKEFAQKCILFKPTEKELNIMIEFAKLHVTEALEQAYLNAELEEYNSQDKICFIANDMGDAYVLDKASILNAYNLNNII